MSEKFTRFLQGVGQGVTNPKGNLGDARHAARLYVDNQFARSPRTKFSYYVQFNINTPALRYTNFPKLYGTAVNALVKQADLPKITLDHEVKNQYNRKRVIYKDVKYEPLNIVFHDDSQGIINAMWAQYLKYYVIDSINPPTFWDNPLTGPYVSNKDRNLEPVFDTDRGPPPGVTEYAKYGLDRDRGNPNTRPYHKPFFSSIQIFTMSRKKFNCYTLVNPYITSWNHGNVEQASSNGTVECTMNIVYETVLYGIGSVQRNVLPGGMMDLYYDNTPSPLTIAGGQLTGLFGAGGLITNTSRLIQGASQIYGEGVLDTLNQGTGLFEGAVKAANLYKSLASLRPENLVAEATGLLFTAPTPNITSGLEGISFGGRKGQVPLN